MSGNLTLFSDLRNISSFQVGLLHGGRTNATKKGTIHISPGLTLCNVLYVPQLMVNLMAVGSLDCFVLFSPYTCFAGLHFKDLD